MRDPDGYFRFKNGMIIPKRFYDVFSSARQKIFDAIYTIKVTAKEMAGDAEDEDDSKRVLNTARSILAMCERFCFVSCECDSNRYAIGNNRAKWIARENENYSPFDTDTEENEYYCSRCHKRQATRTKFCPDCGAKMEVRCDE